MINVNSFQSKEELVAFQKKRSAKNIAFEGRRTDLNFIKDLANDNGENISKPRERVIIEALGRLSKESDSSIILEMLNTAKNLKYGVRKGSDLDAFLSKESSIADKQQKATVDWEALLKDAITKAIKNTTGDQKTELEKVFKEVFPEAPTTEQKAAPSYNWLSVTPDIKNMTNELVNYRKAILNSKEFIQASDNEKKAAAQKHLDYFIASPKLTFKEKVECLKQLAYLLSDDYKINTQLADKKFQVFSELINDILIETPESPVLTIKDMSQRNHGMCAAICASRKAMAHEFKLQYISDILAVLENKQTMELYDLTDPKDTDQVIIVKAPIDYNYALTTEYSRIVDASTTVWMDIVDQMGNSLRKGQKYVPFNPENRDVFTDAHMELDLAPEYLPKQNLLRATTKVKDHIKKLKTSIFDRKEAAKELETVSKEYAAFSQTQKNNVKSILSNLSKTTNTEIPEKELDKLTSDLINPKRMEDEKDQLCSNIRSLKIEANKLENQGQKEEAASKKQEADLVNYKVEALNNLIIDKREGPITKKQKLTNIILTKYPNVSKEQLNKTIDELYNIYNSGEKLYSKERSLVKTFERKGTYRYVEEFFNLACYNRARTEFEIKIPEKLQEMAKKLGVPAEADAVLKKLEDSGFILNNETLDAMDKEFINLRMYFNEGYKKRDANFKTDEELFTPLDKYTDVFKTIEASIPRIEGKVRKDFIDLYTELEPQLNALYNRIGQTVGTFWVHPKIDSGLYVQQRATIPKRITGKDMYIQPDASLGLKEIREEGNKAPTTSTMVSAGEFSSHAQYAVDVDENHILYHDNTWGHNEEKEGVSYTDDKGTLNTDYGNGYGPYILSKQLTTGTTEDQLVSGTGVHHADKAKSPASRELEGAIGTEFAMFREMVLKGHLPFAKARLEYFTERIRLLANPDIGNYESLKFLERLIKGNTPKIDKLISDLSVDIYNTMFKAINDGQVDSLKEQIKVVTDKAASNAKPSIFKKDGMVALSENLSKDLKEKLTKELKSGQLDSILITDIIEDSVRNNVYAQTKPGEEVNLKSSSKLDKTIDNLKEQITNMIRGNTVVMVGLEPEKLPKADEKLVNELTTALYNTVMTSTNNDESSTFNKIKTDPAIAGLVSKILGPNENTSIIDNFRKELPEIKVVLESNLSDTEKKASVTKIINNWVNNVPLINKIATDFSNDLNKIVIETIGKGESQTLNKIKTSFKKPDISPIVFDTVDKIFDGEKKQELTRAVSGLLPKVNTIMKSNQPDTDKKAQVSKMISECINTEVYKQKFYSGIKTREDFALVPDNHILKIILNKMSMIGYGQTLEEHDTIDRAKTPEELKKADALVVQKQKEKFRTYFNKTPQSLEEPLEKFKTTAIKAIQELDKSENVDLSYFEDYTSSVITKELDKLGGRIYDGSFPVVESALQTAKSQILMEYKTVTNTQDPSIEQKLKEKLDKVVADIVNIEEKTLIAKLKVDSFGRRLINWIDTKFNPATDKEFIQAYKSLKNMTTVELDKLLESSSPEELGIKYKDPYVILQRIQGLNDYAKSDLGEAIAEHTYYDIVGQKIDHEVARIVEEHKVWIKTDEGKALSSKEQIEVLNKKIDAYYENKADINGLFKDVEGEFSYLGWDGFIKTQKKAALRKYGAISVAPVIKPASEQQLKELIKMDVDNLENMVKELVKLKTAQKDPKYANDPDALDQIIKNTDKVAQNIKFNKVLITKGLVRLKTQNKVLQLMNEWIKEASKNPGSAKTSELKTQLEKMMVTEHMLNHPKEFFDTIVQQVPKMLYDGTKISNIDNALLNIWKTTLSLCVRASKEAQIEFKIRNETWKGNLPQIAKTLRSPETTFYPVKAESSEEVDIDKVEKVPFDSKEGIEYLFQALGDPVNKNSTLKYFIEQMGLTKTAVNYFLKGPDPQPEIATELIDKYVKELNNFGEDQKLIHSTFETLTNKLSNIKLTVPQLNQVVNGYFAELDKAFTEKGRTDSQVLPNYKNAIVANIKAVNQRNIQPPDGNAMNFLIDGEKQFLQAQDMFTNQVVSKAANAQDTLNIRLNALNMLDELVPDQYTQLKSDITNCKSRLKEAIEKIDNTRKGLEEPLQKKFAAAQEEIKAKQAELSEQFKSMPEEDKQQVARTEAETMIGQLVFTIQQKNQPMQQNIIKQLTASENPVLDDVLVEIINEVTYSPLKDYAMGILADRGVNLKPVAEYVKKAMDKDGQLDRTIQDDPTMILAVNILINETMKPEMTPDNNKKLTSLIAKVFKASAGAGEQTPFMDKLFVNFLNNLSNKGPAIQKMLVGMILDKTNTSIYQKGIVIDILSKYDSIAYFNLFKDIAHNPDKFVSDKDNSAEKLFILKAALGAVYTLSEKYKGLDYKPVLNDLLKVNIAELADKAKQEDKYDPKEIDLVANDLTADINEFAKILEGKDKQVVAA